MTTELADATMKTLRKLPSGFELPNASVRMIETRLAALRGKPTYQSELEGLLRLAFLLGEKKRSPIASGAIMGAVSKVVGKNRGATTGGWARK